MTPPTITAAHIEALVPRWGAWWWWLGVAGAAFVVAGFPLLMLIGYFFA